MKIICSKSNLLKCLNISLRAVPVRTTMSILECVLIDASSSVIRFISNDMELGIETIVTGEIKEKGIVALNAKIFSDIIRKLPENDVVIQTDADYRTLITCERSKFHIPGHSGDDFSFLPIIDRDNCLTITQFSLKNMIQATNFSILANDNNPLMTGELFEIRNNNLRLASLDGHRISIRMMHLSGEYPDTKVIVPGKTLNEVSKILSGEIEDTERIYFTKNHILFELPDTIILSRLIEGEYFRIDQMITFDYETKVTINRKMLLDCLDRSTLLIKESDKKPLIFHIQDDMIDISLISAIGAMTEEIEIEKEGKDITIGYNPRFLIEALRVIDDEEVNLYFVNPKAPCYIRNEDNSYIYLILPININQG